MTAAERQDLMMATLREERSASIGSFASVCGCSERTICRDIDHLAVSGFPLKTKQGHGGGVRLEDWYYPHSKTLSRKQLEFLWKVKAALPPGEDLTILESIIDQFGPRR